METSGQGRFLLDSREFLLKASQGDRYSGDQIIKGRYFHCTDLADSCSKWILQRERQAKGWAQWGRGLKGARFKLGQGEFLPLKEKDSRQKEQQM